MYSIECIFGYIKLADLHHSNLHHEICSTIPGNQLIYYGDKNN